MAQQLTLNARPREETGKNSMRRLRKSGFIPGIVFGRSGETTQVSFEPEDLEHIIHSDTGFNTIFKIDIEGQKSSDKPMVIIKEYQVDPVTHDFLHISFYRVHMDRLVEIRIPVTPEGVSPGVKTHGGTVDLVMREMEVRCLPGDIPESIAADISELEINDYVRLTDLVIPKGVEILEDPDSMVLHILPPRKVEEEVEVEEALEGVAPEGEEEEEDSETDEKPAAGD